jgi:hypothetical protein
MLHMQGIEITFVVLLQLHARNHAACQRKARYTRDCFVKVPDGICPYGRHAFMICHDPIFCELSTLNEHL